MKPAWFAGVLVWGVAAGIALACPMCQESLMEPGQAAAQSMKVKAYLISVAAMIGTPMILVGGIAWWVTQSARSHRRQSVDKSSRQR